MDVAVCVECEVRLRQMSADLDLSPERVAAILLESALVMEVSRS